MAISLFCISDDECKNDAAVNTLANIYGNDFVHAFFTGSQNPSMVSPEANAMAPILLGGLADIAGIVAIFMLFTITAIALLNSAQDGEAFGKGAAGHIITGRMLLSGILLLPTPSGYCVVQIMLMFIILGSNAATNYIYQKVVKASALSSITFNQNISSNSIKNLTNIDIYGVRGFSLAHFQQNYCVNLLNANYGQNDISASGQITLKGQTYYISDIYLPSMHPTIGAIASDVLYEGGDAKTGTPYRVIKLGAKNTTIAKQNAPVCGSMRLTYPSVSSYEQLQNSMGSSQLNTALGLQEATQREIFQQISNISMLIAENKRSLLLDASAQVTTWMNTNITNYNVTSSDYSTVMASVDFVSFRKLITDFQQKAANEYYSIIVNNNMPELIKSLVDALTQKGWTYAGGIKQRIIAVQGQQSTTNSRSVISLTQPNLNYLEINDPREPKIKAAFANARSVVETALGKAEFAQYSDEELIAQSINENMSEDSDGKAISSEVNDKIVSMMTNIKRRFVNVLLTGEFSEDSLSSLSVTNAKADWLNNDTDVMANIQRAGEWMGIATQSISGLLQTTKTASTVAVGVSGWSDTVRAIADSVFLFLEHVITPFLSKILFCMQILFFYMAIMIPSMPYFFFITAVVAWYVHTLQAMAGLPFWAVMHMTPERSFVGSQQQGYVTLISLFLRPLLTITGLFFAFMMANPILLFVTDAFFTMQEGLLTTSSSNWLGAIATEFVTFTGWMVIYCTLVMQICYMIFGLAGALPDTVLQWLGSGLQGGGWGQSNAQTALDNSVKNNGIASSPGTSDGKQQKPPENPNPGNGGGNPSPGTPGNSPSGDGTMTNTQPSAAETAQSVNQGVNSSSSSGGSSGESGGGLGGGVNTPTNSVGGVKVGADGKALSTKDMLTLNRSETLGSQKTGNKVDMLKAIGVGATVGSIAGAVKGVSKFSNTYAESQNSGNSKAASLANAFKGVGQSVSSGLKDGANRGAHAQDAQNNGVNMMNHVGAYNSLNNAPK